MTLYYAGIGSRRTPSDALDQMTIWAKYLCSLGYILRSGGATGADTAFEHGAGNRKEIFTADSVNSSGLHEDALRLAAMHHPAWGHCSEYARLLHARNGFQILGPDLLTPVDFVLCWTPDGAESYLSTTRETGGTGQAIRIASRKGIPVFNMSTPTWYQRLVSCILTQQCKGSGL